MVRLTSLLWLPNINLSLSFFKPAEAVPVVSVSTKFKFL